MLSHGKATQGALGQIKPLLEASELVAQSTLSHVNAVKSTLQANEAKMAEHGESQQALTDRVNAALADADAALARLVGERIAVVLREDRARVAQLRSRGSLALLAEASEMFAGTLDVQLGMTLAAQLVVPRFARWSAVWATDERVPRLMSVAHADEARLPDLQAVLGSADGELLALRLAGGLGERRPNLLPGSELPTELAEERSGEVLALPLVARRRLGGILLVGRPPGGIFGPDDVSLLNDLARRTAVAKSRPRHVSLTSIESKCPETSEPAVAVAPSSRTPAPPGDRYAMMRPVSGRNPFAGSSVVMRVCSAEPLILTVSWLIPRSARVSPDAIRICAETRSMSVTSSVTVCSTWIRGFISMKTNSPVCSPTVSSRNSTVPAFW